eukprot:4856980-Pyramimonas_sp.AAC.1
MPMFGICPAQGPITQGEGASVRSGNQSRGRRGCLPAEGYWTYRTCLRLASFGSTHLCLTRPERAWAGPCVEHVRYV